MILKIFDWIKSKNNLTEEQIELAYKNYADSLWTPSEDPSGKTGLIAPTLWGVRPMEYSFETFSDKCKKDKSFYRKYTKKYSSPYNNIK